MAVDIKQLYMCVHMYTPVNCIAIQVQPMDWGKRKPYFLCKLVSFLFGTTP